LNSQAELRQQHRQRIEEALALDGSEREGEWIESIAVGSEDFVRRVQGQFKKKMKKREIGRQDGIFMLSEGLSGYGPDFGVKNRPIGSK